MSREKTKQKKRLKIRRFLWIAYVIIIVSLFIAVQVVPQVSEKLTETSLVKFGEIKLGETVSATVVRDDQVFFCKTDCRLEALAEEYTQVKVGTRLFKYKTLKSKADEPEKSEYDKIKESLSGYYKTVDDGLAKSKGVFSMQVDGSEAYFRPKNIEKMRKSDAKAHIRNSVNLKRKKALAGEPIYKISDNSRWYMVFWTDKKNQENYEPGSSLDVFIDDWKMKCIIESVSKEGSKYKVVLSTNRYYKDFTSIRQVNIEVIALQASGLLVDNDDIVRRNKKDGVIVVDKAGNRNFVPVNKLETDGKKTVVSENSFFDKKGRPVKTVKVFDEILSNPD